MEWQPPESEEHFRLALEAARMGTWEWNSTTGVVSADAAHQSLFGLPPQTEPQPDPVYWARLIPEEIALGLERAKAALKDGTEFQMEQRLIRPAGEVRWILSRGRAKLADPNCMIGISFDITDRKRMEEALQRSEARLQSAVDLLGLGLYAWDPQTNAFEWDTRVKGMWGLPPDAHIDYGLWRDRVHPDDLARVEAAVAKCADPNGDGVYAIEYRVNGMDGMERWVATHGRTTFESARPVHFFGVALDITERKRGEEREKRAEQRIRDKEERFRQFAEHSSNVLWILNVDTRQFEYLSPAFDGLWRRSRDETRDYWTETIHADDRERASRGMERALLGDLVVQEYRIVRPDGSVCSVRDTVFPIRDPHERVKWVGGIAQDITIHDALQAYLIDADATSRQKVAHVLYGAGYAVKTFTSGADFLEMAHVLSTGCVVLNIESAPSEGLQLLRQLKANGNNLPLIVTGVSSGNVTLAIQAMKAGAVDWLEMPYPDDQLLMAVSSALADIRFSAARSRDAEFARARVAGMSVRERQVLEGLLAGGTNKVIGRALGISPRTVELYRASVMERLGVGTLPEAVLMAAAAGVRPAPRRDPRKPSS
jgi:PAS domain S-box-containing protein